MYAKLVGHEVVPCSNEEALHQWDPGFNRHVAKDQIGEQMVSTVFLVLDHGFSGDRPLWFETMIFEGEDDGWCERYATWDRC